jgi:hypothetical protein
MRRDLDLFRIILLKVEALPPNQQYRSGGVIPGYTPEEVFYHVDQMQKSNLVEASLMSPDGFIIYDLTPDGHEFIASAKSDKVWNKAKQTVISNAGTWTLEAIKYALKMVMQAAVHGRI